MSIIQVFLPRVVGVLVAMLCGWLLTHYGIDINRDTQAQIASDLATWILPLVLLLYGLTHRLLSKVLNPGDAASAHLAEAEAKQTEQLKQQD